jgi:hypothetical protein
MEKLMELELPTRLLAKSYDDGAMINGVGYIPNPLAWNVLTDSSGSFEKIGKSHVCCPNSGG